MRKWVDQSWSRPWCETLANGWQKLKPRLYIGFIGHTHFEWDIIQRFQNSKTRDSLNDTTFYHISKYLYLYCLHMIFSAVLYISYIQHDCFCMFGTGSTVASNSFGLSMLVYLKAPMWWNVLNRFFHGFYTEWFGFMSKRTRVYFIPSSLQATFGTFDLEMAAISTFRTCSQPWIGTYRTLICYWLCLQQVDMLNSANHWQNHTTEKCT